MAEPKLDGWRVTVAVGAGRVVVRTRRGQVITDSVPGIDALAGPGRDLLLDGELVAGAGRASDFYALLPLVSSRTARRYRGAGPPRFASRSVCLGGPGAVPPAGELGGRASEVRVSPVSVSFWAFDLLWADGELLTGRPYTERRAALEALTLPGRAGSSPTGPAPTRPICSTPVRPWTWKALC